MRHYIVVKFKDGENWRNLIPSINSLFSDSVNIDGVSSVKIHESNSTRKNRFHLMIELNLTASGLENFDNSDIHVLWKEKYGSLLESKTIFDCDD